MVLHYFNSSDILVADAIRSDAVLAAKQVGTFDVELVDILALILYLAAFRHVNTGHTFQHIANGAVLRLCETTDIVTYSIAVLPNAVCLYSYFL